jgi:hypothetical protein
MTTKKTNKTVAVATESNPLQGLFDMCPYPTFSDFERQNFQNQTGTAYARYIIETINRLRKIDSDLETETRTFEKNCLLAEKEKLQAFLEGEDQKQLESAITNWEFVEKEYWSNFLGKQAAVEILTLGKPSYETMNKMVKLPEDLYIKSTQTCVRLANAIKSATERAEAELGIVPQTESGPRKLALKKVK